MAIMKNIRLKILIVLVIISNSIIYSQNNIKNDYYQKYSKHEYYLQDSLCKTNNFDSVYSVLCFEEINWDCLPKYNNLLYLFISAKEYTFDYRFEQLKNLEYLNIPTVEKMNFENSLKSFQNLKIIKFSETQYLKEFPVFVKNTDSLRHIGFKLKNAKRFDFSDLIDKEIECLVLNSVKRIKEIPNQIYQIKSLKYLFIGSKRQFKISKEIINLENLEKLVLSIELNDENIEILSNIKALKTLSIDKIDLKDLEKLKLLNHLEYFYCMEFYKDKELKEKVEKILPNVKIKYTFL